MRGLLVNKNFFSSWNPEMSYVLGIITADGCRVAKHIRKDGSKQFLLDITSKDVFLLKKIKKAMLVHQKISIKYSDLLKGKGIIIFKLDTRKFVKIY
ncbi:MAG: hypothetical protein COT34_00850 [Candidatus Nealsonbacteria bacterium CG08_land_8_20_14_0_20_43_11]|uniref:Homing endonuclease LAGLIDADG domain-containing protein n=1 Tax=Candidatus Nealsonbacteria bacterium CG08_land_8_20_14_0_20_43_11 TaxID=1974706 RepID=A0A2M6T0Y8_9BACT|nr:MAG: hypothetical protein COT34_00850 [Candidatus Nealsonbacteria bacterium CG08_land_8_20_14_0_20_43_11]